MIFFIRWAVLLLILLASIPAKENYFQQDVRYKMDVRLDIEKHTIGGHSIIEYTNNSPDELDAVYLHLLPNAFQEESVKHREYLQQWGPMGRAANFVKRKESYFSRMEVNHFSVTKNGAVMADTFKVDDTILSAHLQENLLPGESMTLEFDWVHYVGEQVERAGRVGKQYNLAQWYPKVVVYDETGWQNIPFHAEGEFYGEFSTFDVTMDVPIWYVIGSTGVVTTGDPGWNEVTVDTAVSFKDWLKTFKENKTEIDSSSRRKVSFHAQQVHDFAWITSPDFLYEHGHWNGIDVHVLYNQKNGEKWTKKVVERSERALAWLSTNFGMYPYPQVTTTDRINGGGMEYPMLVMNGSESEGLIVHEIGHIWFYGILGNNEVKEAWLDEGFTTFQTGQYMINRYGPAGFDISESKDIDHFLKKHGRFSSFLDNNQWSAIRYILSGSDEPVSRNSYMFNHRGSYLFNAYNKPGLMLVELKYILGDTLFYNGMKEYFKRWNLKHVNEDRFIAAMEDISGQDLDWFFEAWLHNTRVLDYGIDQWSKTKNNDGTWTVNVDILKHGNRELPQLLEVTMVDGSKQRFWWKNHNWRKKDTFTFQVEKKPRSVMLDPDGQTLDVDFRNNYTCFMPREKQFNWLDNNYNPRKVYVNRWTPTIAYHELDGYVPGFWLNRKYGHWENLVLSFNYAPDTQNFYWSFNRMQKLVHRFKGFSTEIQAFDQGSVVGYGLKINHHLNESFADFVSNAASLGFYVSFTKDTLLTNLFDPGQVSVLYGSYGFALKENLKINLNIATTPGSVSDWLFSRFNATAAFELNKGKFGIRNRAIVGYMSSETGVPKQERFSIAGAGSTDLFSKSYLRDESSFFGNTDLRQHYHLPGDANLRGYFGDEFAGSESVMANTLELYFKPPLKKLNPELALFIDDGWIWGSKYRQGDEGFNGDYLVDAGFGLRIAPTVLGKKMYLRIDMPILLKNVSNEKSEIDLNFDKWLFSFSKSI